MSFSKFISWLNEPVEGPIPVLDKFVIIFSKLCYSAIRFSLRIILGRNRRERIHSARKFWLARTYSPSFNLMIWLFRIFGTGKDKDGIHLLKIRVPNHGYEYFCRIEKGDFNPLSEEDIVTVFTPKDGEIVVDVGAHIGRYTTMASKRVGSRGKVVAIEASPSNFDMLTRNVCLNKLTNVSTINCAAYSTESKVKLYEPNTNFSIYNTLMSGRANIGLDTYVEIDAHTLDFILESQKIEKVNWIKIDVEGAEFEVLKGAQKILSNSKNISVLVEVHSLQNGNYYNEIMCILTKNNFKMIFEKVNNASGERHILMRKSMVDDTKIS